jgi:hypothetical protein
MAATFTTNVTDTAISGVTALAFAERGLINFEADFARRAGQNGDLRLINITSPPGCLEVYRYSYNEVSNIYSGFNIDPAYQLASRRGANLLVGLTEVWSKGDDTDATYRKDSGISGHIVLKYPQDEIITAARMEAFIGRLLSGLYNTGKESTVRMGALLRGSLEPFAEV